MFSKRMEQKQQEEEKSAWQQNVRVDRLRENVENERLNRCGRVSGKWREKRGRGRRGGGGGYI